MIRTVEKLRRDWAEKPRAIYSYRGEHPMRFTILRFGANGEVKIQRVRPKHRPTVVEANQNAKMCVPCYRLKAKNLVKD